MPSAWAKEENQSCGRKMDKGARVLLLPAVPFRSTAQSTSTGSGIQSIPRNNCCKSLLQFCSEWPWAPRRDKLETSLAESPKVSTMDLANSCTEPAEISPQAQEDTSLWPAELDGKSTSAAGASTSPTALRFRLCWCPPPAISDPFGHGSYVAASPQLWPNIMYLEAGMSSTQQKCRRQDPELQDCIALTMSL